MDLIKNGHVISIALPLNIYNEIVTIISDLTIPEARKKSVIPFAINPVILLFSITLIFLVIRSNRKKLLEIYNKY